MKLNQEQGMGILRHLIGFAGGLGTAAGIGTDTDWQMAGGALAGLLSVFWSVRSKDKK